MPRKPCFVTLEKYQFYSHLICIEFTACDKIKPDFPSLADEMAEPRPDMNIKVAAFTVSEKSSKTNDWCIMCFVTRKPV